MALRKSPTLTPGLLEACRRNAQKSTGPRTVRGMAQTRMNALRGGGRSRLWREFAEDLFYAPPGGVERAVRELLTPELARHRLFAEHAEVAIEAELPEMDRLRQVKALCRRKGKKSVSSFDIQSGNVIENKSPQKIKKSLCVDVVENNYVSRFCVDVLENK